MKNEMNNEDYIKELICKSNIETPSDGFTLKIMQQIENEVAFQKLHTPLISKKIWLIIGGLFIVFLLITFYFLMNLEIKPTSNLFFQKVFRNNINNLFSGIRISKTLTFSLVLFFVLGLLQMFFITSYYNKRMKF
ncbi:conserved hypothetical protein [Flavobacterium sp. 9AF]|uniref:hypothetical protein n=1 Tax=Flavobacterium sp. 9AF TaxID=2653142 RepID=UPI0012EFBBCD|nr:hypothetical protein [Flavobacterium sp. 9AF]VXB12631.1 conserved hypothetical protein [Flavobacterium sp. 9AF]